MGANAAISENRPKIYAAMYQAAGEKWVKAGAVSHAICLYAHDEELQQQFFRYGFGLRCIAIIATALFWFPSQQKLSFAVRMKMFCKNNSCTTQISIRTFPIYIFMVNGNWK